MNWISLDRTEKHMNTRIYVINQPLRAKRGNPV